MGIEETGVGMRLPSLLFNKLLTLSLLQVMYIKKENGEYECNACVKHYGLNSINFA